MLALLGHISQGEAAVAWIDGHRGAGELGRVKTAAGFGGKRGREMLEMSEWAYYLTIKE